jgi:ethanolamine ammonia-lyase small subunit
MTELARMGLRAMTPARVGLGRVGDSLDTTAVLDFAMAHAMARDAVHATLSVPSMLAGLAARGLEAVAVKSAAGDRATYLRRPDLGRRLGAGVRLEAASGKRPRLTVIVADGLSALAADRHALPLLDALMPLLGRFSFTAAVVAEQARVALGDEIGERLGSDLTVMLIGERPGLSSADSLGAYLTWGPRVGRTDAERNCVSNIRVGGLEYEAAAGRIAFLCEGAMRLGLTGVGLKDGSDRLLGRG